MKTNTISVVNQANKHKTHQNIATILRGAGIGILAKGAGAILEFMYTIVLSRTLGISIVGYYFFGLSAYRFFRALNVGGLDYAARRYVSKVENLWNLIKIFSYRWVGVTLIIYLSLIALIIYNQASYEPRMKAVFWFMAIAPIGVIVSIIALIYQGMKKINISSIIQDVIPPTGRIIFFFPIIWFGLEFQAPLLTYLLSILVACLVAIYSLSSTKYKMHQYLSTPVLLKDNINYRDVASYSNPMLLTTLINLVIIWGITLLLGLMSTVEQVSLYAISARVLTVTNLLLVSITTIYEPVCAELFHPEKKSELEKIYSQTTSLILLVVIPTVMVGIIISKTIMGLFGSDLEQGTTLLIILLLGQLMGVICGPAGSTLVMGGYQKIFYRINVCVAIIVTFLGVLLIPRYGALSAAIISTIGFTLRHISSLSVLYLKEKIHPFRSNVYIMQIVGIIGVFLAIMFNNTLMGYLIITVYLLSITGVSILKKRHKIILELLNTNRE